MQPYNTSFYCTFPIYRPDTRIRYKLVNELRERAVERKHGHRTVPKLLEAQLCTIGMSTVSMHNIAI
jgi:hypothetical protein